MADLTLRGVKGSPLTNQEVDDNFSNLNTAKYESGDSPTFDGVTANSIQIIGGTGTQGTLSWNVEEQTLDLDVGNDVVYQLGQETGLIVRNLSGVALSNGTVVRVTGSSGDKLTVDLADATTELGSAPSVGVVTETINNNSTGRVTTAGLVRGLDTSAFTAGVAIYLGASGTFTATKPVSPDHLVHIGWVVRSHATEGIILVHVNNGWELDELHDVKITNLSDGQIIQWNATNGVWENIDIPVSLPDQTGASGKFLTTDGTTASWDSITESDISDFGTYVSTNSAQALHATDPLTLTANTLYLNRADGTSDSVDLSIYIDDTNLARITSGVYVAQDQVLRFTRDDASTFDVDASMFFDDTNLVTSVNSKTGAVVLTAADVGAAPSSHTHSYDNYVSWTISDGTNSEAIASGNTLTILGTGATTATYVAATNTLTINSTDNDTVYSLPLATASVRGGVKIGYVENGNNYPVELSSEKMFVNVPWTDTTYSNATQSVSGLMSSTDKTKLDGIEASADVTDATNVAAAGAIMDGDFTANGFMKRTGAGTYTVDTNTYAVSTHTHSYLPLSGGNMTGSIYWTSHNSDRLDFTNGNAHCLGSESYYNTYGPFSGGWNSGTIGHKFFSHNGTVIATIGTGGSSVNLASNFYGNVTVAGLLTATSKSFTIDHPTKEGFKLRYGSLEGPENGVYVRGRLTGGDTIELPEYWVGLVHEDSITVSLTPVGQAQSPYVLDVSDNKVVVAGCVDCFYHIFAERKDIDKLVVEFEAEDE